MKKVGILGGTFDPIHVGHVEIARAALYEFDLSEVRIMTGGNPPHKRERQITDAKLRHVMVQLALYDEQGIVPDDYEIEKTDYSYTAITLTELKKLHPDWEIYFIIGEDSLYDLPKWYNPSTVTQNCIMLVYPRDNGSDIDTLIADRKREFNADIRKITAPFIKLSSTEVRARASEGASIHGMVPKCVEAFIKEMELYK